MANKQDDVKVRLSAEGVQDVVNALRKINNEAKKTDGFDSMARSIGGINTAIKALAGAAGFYIITQQIKDAVAAGVDFNKTMESAQFGIAALISAQAKIVDDQGNVLEGQDAYNAALGMSADLMKKLQLAGMQTAATTQQLVTAFQAALSAGMGSGITDMEKLLELTISITQAASAMQVPMDQLRQEIQSILSGNISSDSTVAKNLGITNEDIKRWKDAGTLVQELQQRLAPFSVAADKASQSFGVLSSNVGEVFDKAAGESTKGLFEKLKEGFGSIFDGLVDKSGNLDQSLEPITENLNTISTGIGQGIVDGIKSAIEGAKEFAAWLKENDFAVKDLIKGFGTVIRQIAGLLGDVIKMAGWTAKTGTEVGVMGVAWRTIAVIIAGVRDGLELMKGMIATVGYLAMEYLAAPLIKAAEMLGKSAQFVSGGTAGQGLVDFAAGWEETAQKLRAYAKGQADLFRTGNTAVGGLLKEFDSLTIAADEAKKSAEDAAKSGAKIDGLKNPNGDKKDNAEKLSKARSDLLRAQADNERRIMEAKNKALDAEERRRYEQGLVSIEDYYKRRREIMQGEADQEAAILDRKLKAAQSMPQGSDEQKIAREKEIAAVKTEQQLAEIDNAQKLADLESERLTKLRDMNQQRMQMEQRLLEAQNQQQAAAEIALKLESERMQLELQRLGYTQQEAAAKVAQFQQATRANQAYDLAAQNLQMALQEMDRAKADVEAQRQAGLISQFEAEQKILEIEQKRLPILQSLAQAQVTAAAATGDQRKQAEANDQQKAIGDIQTGLRGAEFSFARLKSTAMDALQGGIANGLMEAAQGAKSFGEAMRGVAQSVIGAIQQMIAQMIALAIMRKIAGFSGGGEVGGSGLNGFADGGYTGDGGMYEPAGVVHRGEFVIRKAVAQQPGMIDALNSLNRSGTLVTAPRMRGFADGGLVGPAGMGAGGDSSMTVGLEEGLVLRHIDTAEGQRVLIKAAAKNRRAFRNALGL